MAAAQPDDVVAAIADALTYVPQIHMLRQTLSCSVEVTVVAAVAAAFGPTSQFLDINVCSPKKQTTTTKMPYGAAATIAFHSRQSSTC